MRQVKSKNYNGKSLILLRLIFIIQVVIIFISTMTIYFLC